MVVTGAAGFIGSHLLDRLLDLELGLDVLAVDSLDPWYDPAHKRANLDAAQTRAGFQSAFVDLFDVDLRALLDGADVVFHLAGRPGVQDSWGPGFVQSNRLNVELTQRIFEAALAVGVGRVVLASSSSVYGNGAYDGRRSVQPVSPYGVTKAAAEQLAAVYGRLGLDVVSLRYFTVYGPRQRPDMAMHRLFEAGLGGAPFGRRGGGDQRRQFTAVEDVATLTAAVGLSGDASLAGITMDVGGGETASLNEVIDLVGELVGRPVPLELIPQPPGDPDLTLADIEPAERLLGWRPTISLRDGLARQLAWHRTRRSAVPQAVATASGSGAAAT